MGWGRLEELFGPQRDGSDLAKAYRRHIDAAMDAHEQPSSSSGSGSGRSSGEHRTAQQQQQRGLRRLAACIIEPVLQGAGGMGLVDPLFQRELVGACRSRNIPVIFDEVFTGLWRLGAPSAASLLRLSPDIACYAKLLTAGTAPLAVTLASPEVFDAYKGSSKLQALLHGHSYTAYPIGCAAAVASLSMLQSAAANPNLCSLGTGSCGAVPPCSAPCGRLTGLWDPELTERMSHNPLVRLVVALGTVLAVELVTEEGGYGSSAAGAVVRALRDRGIFARPLGNVVYFMCTPTSSAATCAQLQRQLLAVLDDSAAQAAAGRSVNEEASCVV